MGDLVLSNGKEGKEDIRFVGPACCSRVIHSDIAPEIYLLTLLIKYQAYHLVKPGGEI